MSISCSSPAMTLKKLMIFMDGSNFLGGVANYQEQTKKVYKINYHALERNLIEVGSKHGLILLEHIKTYFYGPKCTPEELKSTNPKVSYAKQIGELVHDLEKNHVRCILKDKIKGKEKGVDVALVTDLLSFAFTNAYDYAIVVSGDADFIGAYDEIKRYGKIVCIASFKSHFNDTLMQYVDKVIFLDEYAGGFLEEYKS